MKRLILSLMILSASLSAENYISVGTGPYIMVPSVGIGQRKPLNANKKYTYDITAQIACDGIDYLATVQGALLFKPKENAKYYLGPMLNFNHDTCKYFQNDTDIRVGTLVGFDMEEGFVDMSFEKVLYSKNYDSDRMQVRFRYGVYF